MSEREVQDFEDPDDSVCTQFRVEEKLYEIDGEPVEAWSFECTRCGHFTVCSGEPKDYGNRPYSCMNCGWVSLIDKEAVETFANERWLPDTDRPAGGGE